MDTLPEKVLSKIFSFCTWQELTQLSLVNRRWNCVAGASPAFGNVSLTLSRIDAVARSDSYVANTVLSGSERQYGGISCSLGFSGDTQIKLAVLGINLRTCFDKWKITRVRIVGQYDQVVEFFQRFGDLLKKVEELSVVLEQFSSSTSYGFKDRDQIILPMGRLQQFSWVERSLPDVTEPMPCSVVFVAPQLSWLKVQRVEKEGMLIDNGLMLFECTKLERLEINSYDLFNSSLFDFDCTTLQQLEIKLNHDTLGKRTSYETISACYRLKQKSEMWRRSKLIHLTGCDKEALEFVKIFADNLSILKLSSISGFTRFDAVPQHLHEIHLESLTLWSESLYFEFPNLKKLTVLEVKFENPLELEAPLLETLIVDQRALKYIKLKDKFTLNNLGLSVHYEDFLHQTTIPEYPNVTHLYLKLSIAKLDTSHMRIESIFSSYRQIRQLTITRAPSVSIDRLVKWLDKLPLLESLHFHSVDFLTFDAFESCRDDREANILKRLLITNSTLSTVSLAFEPYVAWLRFHRVRIAWTLEMHPDTIELFPESLCPPLDREKCPGRPVGCYSTRGFRFDEDAGEMLNW